MNYSPSEKEGKERPCQIQPLVSIMISVIQFPPTQGCVQQSMYHIAVYMWIVMYIHVCVSLILRVLSLRLKPLHCRGHNHCYHLPTHPKK